MGYIGLALVVLAWAVIVLPLTAQAESPSDVGIWTLVVYALCASISITGFALQAIARYGMMKKPE